MIVHSHPSTCAASATTSRRQAGCGPGLAQRPGMATAAGCVPQLMIFQSYSWQKSRFRFRLREQGVEWREAPSLCRRAAPRSGMDLLEILAAGSGGGLGSIGASCGGVRGKEELGLSPRTDPRPSPAPPAPTRGDGGPTPRQLEDDEDGTYTPRFVSAKPSGRKPAVLTRSLNSPRINALNSPRAAQGSRGAGSLGSPRASLPSGRREELSETVMSISLARSLAFFFFSLSLSLSLSSAASWAAAICRSVHFSVCPFVCLSIC